MKNSCSDPILPTNQTSNIDADDPNISIDSIAIHKGTITVGKLTNSGVIGILGGGIVTTGGVDNTIGKINITGGTLSVGEPGNACVVFKSTSLLTIAGGCINSVEGKVIISGGDSGMSINTTVDTNNTVNVVAVSQEEPANTDALILTSYNSNDRSLAGEAAIAVDNVTSSNITVDVPEPADQSNATKYTTSTKLCKF